MWHTGPLGMPAVCPVLPISLIFRSLLAFLTRGLSSCAVLFSCDVEGADSGGSDALHMRRMPYTEYTALTVPV